MNSFDIWDTVLARRFMRDEWHWRGREGKPDPMGYEFANLIPIAENVAKVKPDDIFISDYGDGTQIYHDFLTRALREVCGLTNKIFVTPGGKYARIIWATVRAQGYNPLTHTGDNGPADVESPKSVGIEGILSRLSPFTEPEQFLYDKGLQNLALICREARLTTFDNDRRRIELLQVNYNFPVLFIASVLLNRRYPDNTLLMSSRDCYQWIQLLQAMYGRGEYWYTSCLARERADENYHRYIQSFKNPLMVDLCGSGKSFTSLPQYPSVLIVQPDTSTYTNIPAMYRGHVLRLEQANTAPHDKCLGVDNDLQPKFVRRSGIDWSKDPNVAAQVSAFKTAIRCLPCYDLTAERNISDDLAHEVFSYLLPHYYDFAADVEWARVGAIADDKEPEN